MSKRAIIVVDIQNDYFPGGLNPLVGIDAAAANAARVIEQARKDGDDIIHVRHEFPFPNAPFFNAGTEGAQINPVVAPLDGETVVLKNHPSSFHETGLGDLLRDKGVGNVVIVGAMSHMCIDATTRAAADSGFKATVIHDACATCDLEFAGEKVPAAKVHAAMMAALAFAYADVRTTDEHLDPQAATA